MNQLAMACAIMSLSVLTACGGGSDAGADEVLLASRADALRELSVLGSVAGFGYYSEGGDRKRGSWRAGARLAKATRTEDCDSGSLTVTDGSAERSFQLFPVQRTVSFERYDARDCVRTDDSGFTVSLDGRTESGSSSNDGYHYIVIGAGDEPATTRLQPADSDDPDSFVISRGTGAYEEVEREGRTESREVALYSGSSYSQAVGNSEAEISTGRSGDPLISITTGTTQTLDGPYSYSTNRCTGGTLRVATLAPLTFNADGLTGGSLRISSGAGAITYSFNPNGSATVQFADGSSGKLAASEVDDAYFEDSDCTES